MQNDTYIINYNYKEYTHEIKLMSAKYWWDWLRNSAKGTDQDLMFYA